MKRLALAAVVVALIATACGDDDSAQPPPTTTSAEAATIDRLQASIAADAGDGGSFALSSDQARCVAEGMVAALGVERFLEGADDLTAFMAASPATDRATVAATIIGCADLTGAFTAELVASGVSDTSAACVADGVAGSEWFPALLSAELAGETADLAETAEFQAQITPLVLECLSPEELANLG